MEPEHLYEQTLSSEQIYNGVVVKLFRDDVMLENGQKTIREVIRHPGGVCVLPIDDKGNIYMVKQFRYPFGEVLLEIPAGKKEPGEEPLECGMRELGEEIGASAKKYTLLGKLYPTVAYDTEVIWMFLAQGLTFSGEQHLDAEEFVDVGKLPYEQALKMVLNDEIPDSKTQLAILRAKAILEKEKEKK